MSCSIAPTWPPAWPHTGAFVRFDLDISEAHREIIICATAREIRQQYEFSAHARLARQAGVSDDAVSAIATGKAPEGLSGIEASLVKYVQELSQNHKISEETFNAVSNHFGTEKTVGITALIGHYMLVGQILSAFEVDLPDGVQPEIT